MAVLIPVTAFLQGKHERWRGPQRGEPQHPRHEQPGHMADLRPGRGLASHRLAQHPLLQRPRGLDLDKCHTQPGKDSPLPERGQLRLNGQDGEARCGVTV